MQCTASEFTVVYVQLLASILMVDAIVPSTAELAAWLSVPGQMASAMYGTARGTASEVRSYERRERSAFSRSAKRQGEKGGWSPEGAHRNHELMAPNSSLHGFPPCTTSTQERHVRER
jgi:hypothetical protein